MNIDDLRKQIPDETSCRKFFENLIWSQGRFCPHCQNAHSYKLRSNSCRIGLYECAKCKRQFTVTTKTPMHSTKLPLWKWILAMYYILNSSKGISSVFLGRLIGVKQSTAWKMGHAIRLIMDNWSKELPLLRDTIEMDQKYFGGNPRYHFGVRHKGGGATSKQNIFVAIQRHGPVVPVPVSSTRTEHITPIIESVTDTSADLMTDRCPAFFQPGKMFASHQTVFHTVKQFARGNIHVNTVESFNATLERVKTGVFHFMSRKHLSRYLAEMSFRWVNRDPKNIVTKMGKKKTIWKPKPIMEQFESLLPFAHRTQLRWQKNGGIRQIVLTI
jgi:transposase-like protein